MARKTKDEAQKTRQLLIESAIAQFAERGVANTTLTDVADAAGVTRGAVYWHFTSKSELFNAIWAQQLPLHELIHERLVLTASDDPLLILREKFVTALQYIARNPRQRALLQILYHKCEFLNDMISESEIRKQIGFNDDVMRTSLENCRAQGVISASVNIDVALIVFHGFFCGLIKNWLLNSKSINLYFQAPALVDNILATLYITRVSPERYHAASY